MRDLHEDQYLHRIGEELRSELEQMMDEKDRDSERSYSHKEVPVETMHPVVPQIESDEFESTI